MTGAGFFQLVALSSCWPSPRRRSAGTWRPSTAPAADGSAPGRPLLRARRAGRLPHPAGRPRREQRWNVYAFALLAFSLVSFLAVYPLQRFQAQLPFNPTDMPAVAPLGAFNVAVSFMTNTNWQWYSGELTMSHLTQMVGLTVQNFVSAAAGMAVVVAIIRGITRRGAAHARQLLGRPHPHHAARSCCRCRSSSPSCCRSVASCRTSTASPRRRRSTRPSRGRDRHAVDPRRPGGQPGRDQAARHERWRLLQRQLGPPVREPRRRHQLRRDLGDPRHPVGPRRGLRGPRRLQAPGPRAARRDGRRSCSPSACSRSSPRARATRSSTALGVDQGDVGRSSSAATSRARTSASGRRRAACGRGRRPARRTAPSTACTTASRPIGGMLPMLHMMLGEVSPGGVGVGLMGILIYALLAVFIAGLMVGRTPEYLGKKIQAAEMKLVVLYLRGHAAGPARLRRRVRGARLGGVDDPQPRRRTACRRSSTTSPRPPTTTARPSPARAPGPTGTRSPRAWRC